ncbi:MAG: radical SAM family heme chaperone HemW [Chloroflexi bacterium]|nr:radical SAM family heme chaperone HemW [Chloroflexota bacterium]
MSSCDSTSDGPPARASLPEASAPCADPGIGLYLHIPFCKTKCHYCDFNAYAGLGAWHARYVAALRREIALAGERYGPLAMRTLFFGGGTPSLLPPEAIAALIGDARRHHGVRPGAEVTLEANPATVELAGLRALRAAGVNRLSFGVQSLRPHGLRALGRDHSAAEAVASYEQARAAGFENVNLDFIYGWPGQTLADWDADLDAMLALRPEHLSLYALTVEQGTPLARLVAQGRVRPADDDLCADMYERAAERLAAAGYRHYEISNWARPAAPGGPALACEHNLVYWRNEPYLGLGCGAHSCFGGRRFWNVLSPQEYVCRVEQGLPVAAGGEALTPALALAEEVMLRLRLDEGLDFVAVAARHGADPRAVYGPALAELAALGLLDLDAAGARLTLRGRLLSNAVFVRLLPAA